MPTYTSGGTTGKPKAFQLSKAKLLSRATTETRNKRLSGIKSIFVDFRPKTHVFDKYKLWAHINGVKFYTPSGGTIQHALDLFQSEGIDAIASTTQGLLNYATANAVQPTPYKFKWWVAKDLTPLRSKIIRASLGDNGGTSYGTTEVGGISFATAAQAESVRGCVGEIHKS